MIIKLENMKKLLIILGVFAATTALSQQKPIKVADGYKIEIKTSAVCEMCKETIEQDLTFEKGVKTVNLDVDTKVVTIVYNDKKTTPEALRTRISKVGYNADEVKRDPESYKKLPRCCQDGAHQ